MSQGNSSRDAEFTLRRRQKPQINAAAPTQGIVPRVPRAARLLALALKFEAMIEQGEVRDYADLARLGYVSRARITQITNLLLLAPDLQEQLLFSATAVDERRLRNVVKVVEWREQRKCFTLAQTN